MRDSRAFQRPALIPNPWLIVLLGCAAGSAAVTLLAVTDNPVRTLLYLCGAAAGVIALVAPQAAVYALTAASIAHWPYGLIKIAGMVVTLSVLLWALASRRQLIPRDPLFWCVTALSVLVCVSAVLTHGQNGYSNAVAYVSFVALYWALTTTTTSARSVQRTVNAMLLSGVGLAVIGLIQYRWHFIWPASASSLNLSQIGWSYADVLADTTVAGSFRIDSLSGAADYMAMDMQNLLPLAVFWTLRQSLGRNRLIGITMCLLIATAMVLTFARAIMVTTVIAVLPLLATRIGWRRSAPLIILSALSVGIVILAFSPLRDRVISIVTEWQSGDASTPGGWRRELLPIAFRMFLDNFAFGVGTGAHQNAIQAYLPPSLQWGSWVNFTQPLHNGYLLVGIELGILGLTLLLLLMFLSWRTLHRLQKYFRQTGETAMLHTALATEIALIGTALNMAFSPVADGTFRYLWVLLALVGALTRVYADRRATSGAGGPP